MARILLVFHSSEGQTEKIAARIADRLQSADGLVDVREAGSAPSPRGYRAVVLGDSIHLGRHSRALKKYATTHAADINSMPSALFQVSLTSASDDESHHTRAHRMVADFIDQTGIDPDVVALFAGALAYTKYGWIKRRVLRSIAKSEGMDTDVTHDHTYTDWEAVDAFADDFIKVLFG